MVELPSIGPFFADRQGAGRIGQKQRPLQWHAQRQAGDEGPAEAVAGAGRVDLLGREGRGRDPLAGAVVDAALRALLQQHHPPAGGEQARRGIGFRLAGAEMGEVGVARQQDVADREHGRNGVGDLGQPQQLLADVGVERDLGTGRLGQLDAAPHGRRDPRAEQGRAHDVEEPAVAEQAGLELRRVEGGSSRVGDVEDEVAPAVCPIGDEGAARRRAGHPPDRAHLHPAGLQPVEVERAEIVGADAADQGGGGTDPRRLVGEDRRGTARIGPGEQAGLEEGLADPGRHDLDQDLADRDDLRHAARAPP